MKAVKPTPAPIPTPEQQLERMKELVREIITVPKSKAKLKRTKRKH
jgi:hypothetical protein